MTTKCYIIEVTTNIENLFNDLNEYGFDYYCEDDPTTRYMLIYIDCCSYEVRDLEEIMKWYV